MILKSWKGIAVTNCIYLICTVLCSAQKLIFVEIDDTRVLQHNIYHINNVQTKVIQQYRFPSTFPPTVYPIGIDYDSTSGTLYWTEDQSGRKGIWRAKEDGSETPTRIFTAEEVSIIDDVAVDPISNLLYYTDRGKNVITVARLSDAKLNSAIVTDVGEPKTLILDYQSSKLYWTDIGRSTIECSDTDGGNRTVLVSTNISKPMSIALDKSDNQLYWVDAGLDRIESYNLVTKVRTLIKSESTFNSEYYGIAVGADNIYYTDSVRQYLMYVNKTDYSDEGQWSTTAFRSLYAIKYIDTNSTTSSQGNKCIFENGGCEGLCIPTPVGRSCRCHSGKRLLQDMTSCSRIKALHGDNIIFLTQHTYFYTTYSRIRGIYGNPTEWIQKSSVRTWYINHPSRNFRGLTFDYRNEALYMTDGISRSIRAFPMNGSLTSWTVFTGTSSANHGVTVDWINGNIYWADQNYEHILVAKLQPDTNITKTIINTGLDRPISLAVYPSKGKLFWSDYGSKNNRIESSDLDGTNRVTIYKASTAGSIRGIAIDFARDRIVFTNGKSLYKMNLDGSNVTTLYTNSLLALYDVAIHESLIFATDGGRIDPRVLIFKEGRTGYNTITFSGNIYDIIMYHEARQPLSVSPCTNAGCAQMCIAAPSTTNSTILEARCLCKDGEKANGTNCIKNHFPISKTFVYSAGDRICFADAMVDDSYKVPHKVDDNCWIRNSNADFRHLAVDVYSQTLFFYDQDPASPTIRKVSLIYKAKNTTVVLGGVASVGGIAVDWVYDHLYWTDTILHEIWASNLDGTAQKILVRDLAYPTSIALNPPDGVMYWIDEMEGSIYKANLDGTEMSVFVSGLVSPTDLTIDFMDSRLLFINNNQTSTVEAVDFLGRNRRTLLVPGQNVSSLAVYKNYISLTLLDTTGVLLTNTSGAYDYQIVNEKGPHDYQYDVLAVDKAVQPLVAGACAGSHGCEQLCLPKPGGYSCVCTDGMKLAPDNKNCVPAEIMLKNFFLVGDDYRHELYQVDKNLTKISAVGIPRDDRPIDVAYDYVEQKVYWSNWNDGTIKRKSLNGSVDSTEIVRNSTGASSRIDGIALDPASRLLYYTDMRTYTIGVMTLDGVYSKKLMDSVYNPRAIVLDPAHGVMYYTTRSKLDPQKARIWTATMDGKNPKSLIHGAIQYPNGLAIDLSVKKMYWIDGEELQVSSATLEGSARSFVLALEAPAYPFGLALVENEDSLYYTDWKVKGIHKIARTQGTNTTKTTFGNDLFNGVNGLVYFGSPNPGLVTSCSVNNGNCSQLCLPTPTGRTCACKGITRLKPDGLSCFDEVTCPHSIPNGNLAACSDSWNIDSQCKVMCDTNFKSSRTNDLKCSRSGKWYFHNTFVYPDLPSLCIEQTCGKLSLSTGYTKNGNCTNQDYVTSECSLQCDAGYLSSSTQQQKNTVICEASTLEWTPPAFTCDLIRCDAFEANIPNGKIIIDGCTFMPNTTCNYLCASGYNKSATAIQCDSKGHWVLSDPLCFAPTTTKPTTATTTSMKPTTATTSQPRMTKVVTTQPNSTITTTAVPPPTTASIRTPVATNTTTTPTTSRTIIGFGTTLVTIGSNTGARGGKDDSGKVAGLAAGLVVAFIVVILVGLAVAYYVYKRRNSGVKYERDSLASHVPPNYSMGPADSVAYSSSGGGNLAFDNPIYDEVKEKKEINQNDNNENNTVSEVMYDEIKVDVSHA